MGNFGTFNVARSGLYAAQTHLAITGHNLSNIGTKGYTRQQGLQTDFYYKNLGSFSTGTNQVGLGTDMQTIRQIRDKFLDINYRAETGKAGFYSRKVLTGEMIENIVGELESEYTTQSVLHDMRKALNELTINPDNIASRGNFVSTSIIMVEKFTNIYDQLTEEQNNIDKQIRSKVTEINNLVKIIDDMNTKIKGVEVSGDNANDFRDIRNVAIDELSEIIPVTYIEQPNGEVDILCEGNPLISNNIIFKVGLRYTTSDYSYVEPVFTNRDDVISVDETQYTSLFKMKGNINAITGTDKGELKALLYSRGYKPITHLSEAIKPDVNDFGGDLRNPAYIRAYEQYEKDKFNIEEAIIPKAMKALDKIFNRVVTLINDSVSPKDKTGDAPYGLDGSQFLEVFKRKTEPYNDRYDSGDNYITEDPDYRYSQYTIGNVEVNELLMNVDGYDKIAFSNSGDPSDTTLILDMLSKWDAPSIKFQGSKEKMSITDSYQYILTDMAGDTNESYNYLDQQNIIVLQLENRRASMSDVSLDEEMVNMMQYQHSYNASARLITTIDSMIDTIINKLGA